MGLWLTVILGDLFQYRLLFLLFIILYTLMYFIFIIHNLHIMPLMNCFNIKFVIHTSVLHNITSTQPYLYDIFDIQSIYNKCFHSDV